MGYLLNSLANLPVDEDVSFYIFAVNGQWEEPLYDTLKNNFANTARSIGSHAVIAMGLQPQEFSAEVERQHLGDRLSGLRGLLPAILITDAHPDQLTESSLRLVVPLRDATTRFGSWQQFLSLLSDYVTGRSDEFLDRFEKSEDLLDVGNKLIEIRPGFFGISLNVNELVNRLRGRT